MEELDAEAKAFRDNPDYHLTIDKIEQSDKSNSSIAGNENNGSNHFKFEKESPVEAATRFAALAEQQELAKNLHLAQEYNQSASKYYYEAMAYMKQKPHHDEDALKTLELLAETHRRKAKLLGMRQTTGVA